MKLSEQRQTEYVAMDSLCMALYGRKGKAYDILGSSESTMLYDVVKRLNSNQQEIEDLSEELQLAQSKPDYDYAFDNGVRSAQKEIEDLKKQVERLRGALEKLAKLGNEPYYGNSTGNTLALESLKEIEEA